MVVRLLKTNANPGATYQQAGERGGDRRLRVLIWLAVIGVPRMPF